MTDEEQPPQYCAKCTKLIEYTVVKGPKTKVYHLECFLCTACDGPLSTRRFHTGADLNPYCSSLCEGKANTKRICKDCNLEITTEDNCMNALDTTFHEKCFKCEDCRVGIARSTFYESGGKVYCEVCFRKIVSNVFRG